MPPLPSFIMCGLPCAYHGHGRDSLGGGAGRLLANLARCGRHLFLIGALLLLALAPGVSWAAPQSSVNTWSPTGAMATARFSHTATLLSNGQVLVAGGCANYVNSCGAVNSGAELYDPTMGVWTPTGAMTFDRYGHTATLLHSGQVLVTGGDCLNIPGCAPFGGFTVSLASAELYNPSTGAWTPVSRMQDARYLHTATLLPTGQVLIAGGQSCAHRSGGSISCTTLSSVELYDPATHTFTPTGSLVTARYGHTATLLPSGQVLVTGGVDSNNNVLASTELYNPATGTWTPTGSMKTPRNGHTATLLGDGQVLVTGGEPCCVAGAVTSAELYDPNTGAWTLTGSMSTGRAFHTATLLPDGMVLVAGGCSTMSTGEYCLAFANAEVYNPRTGQWSLTESMASPRSSHTATLLPNGQVLVAGGEDCFYTFGGGDQCPVLTAAELYTPGPGPFVQVSPGSLWFSNQAVGTSSSPQTITVTNTGTLSLVVTGVALGGANPIDYTQANTCPLAPVAPGRSCIITVRFAPTAVGSRPASLTIADNAPTSPQVVSLSGYATGPNGWVATGSMTTARVVDTATLLPNGKVLAAGGESGCSIDGCQIFSSAELYDPSTGVWTGTGSMTTARSGQTATLLPDGKVLVAGGADDSNYPTASAELYDPATGTFTLTGSMTMPRADQTATLLPTGKVLVAGGCSGHTCGLASAELYDPSAGTWAPTGAMTTARAGQTATLLPDGKVLVVGGEDQHSNTLASAELYDPATGAWTATGSMAVPRINHTATLLPDGQVLVAGGCSDGTLVFGCPMKQASAELYDPASGTWTATGSMALPRDEHTATLLLNGQVLVAGGDIGTASPSAEVYNPRSGLWSATGAMVTPAPLSTATRLANGNVLVAGGAGTCDCFLTGLAGAELYTPGPGPLVSLSPGSLDFGNQLVGTTSSPQTITVTNTGNLPLIVGSITMSGPNPSAFAETDSCTARPVRPAQTCTIAVRFTPPALGQNSASLVIADNAPTSPQSVALSGWGAGPGGWAITGSMTTARAFQTATLLPDGQVLVAGGCNGPNCANAQSSAELYDPNAHTWTVTGAMSTTRVYHTATLLPDGQVLVAGGDSNYSAVNSAELYDANTGTWTTTGAMATNRADHTATLLPNGQVLVTGGSNTLMALSTAELYDPGTGTWTTTGSMTTPRSGQTATLLPNGRVLVAGGIDETGFAVASAELYDPTTGIWTATGSMATPRKGQTATLLPSGKVLVSGGLTCTPEPCTLLSSAELYDPSTGTWTATGSMITPRSEHTATLLRDGQVLVAGGVGLATAELYNPSTGAWVATGTMSAIREDHTATLLHDGQVLVAGGCCDNFDSLASAELYIP